MISHRQRSMVDCGEARINFHPTWDDWKRSDNGRLRPAGRIPITDSNIPDEAHLLFTVQFQCSKPRNLVSLECLITILLQIFLSSTRKLEHIQVRKVRTKQARGSQWRVLL